MLAKNKGIIIGLGTVILIAVVYLIFFDQGPTADLTSSSTTGSPAELYFVNLSQELSDISFDTTVLNDPRFAALTDIRTAILPENTGRTDPFAPIPGVVLGK